MWTPTRTMASQTTTQVLHHPIQPHCTSSPPCSCERLRRSVAVLPAQLCPHLCNRRAVRAVSRPCPCRRAAASSAAGRGRPRWEPLWEPRPPSSVLGAEPHPGGGAGAGGGGGGHGAGQGRGACPPGGALGGVGPGGGVPGRADGRGEGLKGMRACIPYPTGVPPQGLVGLGEGEGAGVGGKVVHHHPVGVARCP